MLNLDDLRPRLVYALAARLGLRFAAKSRRFILPGALIGAKPGGFVGINYRTLRSTGEALYGHCSGGCRPSLFCLSL